MSKKSAPGLLKFLNLLFPNTWKRGQQKNCARNFKIRKYAFLNNWKWDEQKKCGSNLKIRKYAFF